MSTVIEETTPQAASTPDAILQAAETLFARQGHEATSMRQITTLAGVNLAAVNYHFGSKEGLVQAVLRRRLAALNQERLRLLENLEGQAQASGQAVKPSQIVDAFFGTLIRMARQDRAGIWPLLERSMTEPTAFIRTLFAQESADVLERYKQAFHKALPGVPQDEIVWRFQFMLGASSFALTGTEELRAVMGWQSNAEDPAEDERQLLPRLMRFLLGGLRAPLQ
ncbi:MAG: TetR/AcrR family transcriptional regulator [Corticimicrobacter sp.]|uniref:TetR/AcrR family transcriptional regulator n=1 Tax=Corticimicrobacter sp. TaxID=2678536 RepID=UPI0032DA6C40